MRISSMRALPHEKSSGAIYTPLHRHLQHCAPNIVTPTWQPQYRTADTIALDNCKIAISTVIDRTVKKYP